MRLFKFFLFFISLLVFSCGDDDKGPAPSRGRVVTAQFVSAGSAHTCAVLDDDSLKCWGSNSEGVLGDGTFADSAVPTAVELANDLEAESIVTGDNHTCAILNDNSLACWGSNRFGQLGSGTAGGEESTPVAVDLGAGRTAKAVSVGGNHTCAVLDDDTLRCWGHNGFGQLGDNTLADKASPTTITLGGNTVKFISTGENHTCAILDDDSLSCWGDNDYGQLGDNSTTDRRAPTSISLGTNTAKFISARNRHTCAILDDDSLSCWGYNGAGQLGDGTTVDKDEPTAVNLGSNTAKVVSVGKNHTCAVLDDDSLSCWGDNGFGQLGDGSTTDRSSPIAVMLGSGRSVRTISVGRDHVCATLDNSALKCWGSNSFGQLGYGAPVYRDVPTAVDLGTATAKATGVGNNHTCVILDDDSLSCWGNNQSGQLGNGNTSNSDDPVAVNLGVLTAKQVSVGNAHTCAVLSDDTLSCWGNNEHGQLGDNTLAGKSVPTAINLSGNTVKMLSTGAFHTCVILNDDSLSCWGSNESGQLGDNSTDDRPAPTAIGLGSNTAKALSAGNRHTCVILDNDSLSCWGRNVFGQLGDGTTTQRLVPTAISLGSNTAKAVSVGGSHTCAILDDDSLSCWGYNSSNQLGDGSGANRDAPAAVNLGSNTAKALSSGHFHTCVILDDDSLTCWGYNASGQLGDGTTEIRGGHIAVNLGTNRTAQAVAASYYTTCAILDDDSLSCWGYTGVAKTHHRGDDADEMGDNLPRVNLN